MLQNIQMLSIHGLQELTMAAFYPGNWDVVKYYCFIAAERISWRGYTNKLSIVNICPHRIRTCNDKLQETSPKEKKKYSHLLEWQQMKTCLSQTAFPFLWLMSDQWFSCWMWENNRQWDLAVVIRPREVMTPRRAQHLTTNALIQPAIRCCAVETYGQKKRRHCQ